MAWMRPLAAKKTWITIAACYGGGFDEVLAPGRVLTAAADANSVAYESSAFQRSYLGEYMVHRGMIEHQADASVETAFSWAQAQLQHDYPDRVPVQYDETPDGFITLSCDALHAQGDALCGYCGGKTRPASLTQAILAHAFSHPPLAMTSRACGGT